MKKQSKTAEEEARGGRARGIVLHPTRTHSSSLSSLYTERRAAMLETTCDEQKNQHIKRKKAKTEAERDDRTERREWITEEGDEGK